MAKHSLVIGDSQDSAVIRRPNQSGESDLENRGVSDGLLAIRSMIYDRLVAVIPPGRVDF